MSHRINGSTFFSGMFQSTSVHRRGEYQMSEFGVGWIAASPENAEEEARTRESGGSEAHIWCSTLQFTFKPGLLEHIQKPAAKVIH